MKAIDKLREELDVCGCDPERCLSCSVPRRVSDGLDEIERETEERYMELPVDKDGVPINVGDTIEYPNGRRDTVRFITINANQHLINEKSFFAGHCRYVKPRTIEDVLCDMIHEYGSTDALTETVAVKYAEEIRKLIGGESE